MPEPSQDRASLRRGLLGLRTGLMPEFRLLADRAIQDGVRRTLADRFELDPRSAVIGCYWPIRGEPDLRPLWVEWVHIGLPEVVAFDRPLRFVRWQPGAPMHASRYGIEVPEGGELLEPDILVVPCLGFALTENGERLRLGYGGGYYDRTLGARAVPTIGVAYDTLRVDCLRREVHDMPLDAIVTESGIH